MSPAMRDAEAIRDGIAKAIVARSRWMTADVIVNQFVEPLLAALAAEKARADQLTADLRATNSQFDAAMEGWQRDEARAERAEQQLRQVRELAESTPHRLTGTTSEAAPAVRVVDLLAALSPSTSPTPKLGDDGEVLTSSDQMLGTSPTGDERAALEADAMLEPSPSAMLAGDHRMWPAVPDEQRCGAVSDHEPHAWARMTDNITRRCPGVPAEINGPDPDGPTFSDEWGDQ